MLWVMRQVRGNSKYLDQVTSRRAFHHAGMSIRGLLWVPRTTSLPRIAGLVRYFDCYERRVNALKVGSLHTSLTLIPVQLSDWSNHYPSNHCTRLAIVLV